MILIYDQWAGYDDQGGPDVAFRHNGLGALAPNKCTVTETLNGEYELTLEHPIDRYGKWQKIQKDRLIRVGVPTAPDPIFEMTSIYQYRITAGFTGTVPLYTEPSYSATIYGNLETGMECTLYGERKNKKTIVYYMGSDTSADDVSFGEVLDGADDGWSCVHVHAASWDGVSFGYIPTKYLRPSIRTGRYDGYFISTKLSVENLEDGKTDYVTDQLFRIYKVNTDLDGVTAYARHVSYDTRQWPIMQYDVNDKVGSGTYADAFYHAHSIAETTRPYVQTVNPFQFLSNYDESVDLPDELSYSSTNLVEVIIGSGGLTEKLGGEFFRNNFAVMYMQQIGTDRGVRIREGKNLNGVSYEEDWSETVLNVIPVGSNDNGDFYLNGSSSFDTSDGTSKYCMSAPTRIDIETGEVIDPSLNDPIMRTKIIRYDGARTVAKLKKAVEDDFANGLADPAISVTVDFINVGDTEEYKQYKFLQGVFLGDTVHAIANKIHVDVALRVTQYTYNCLTGRYDSITLGTPKTIDLKV